VPEQEAIILLSNNNNEGCVHVFIVVCSRYMRKLMGFYYATFHTVEQVFNIVF